MPTDIWSYVVILVDLVVSIFLMSRVVDKKATLDRNARLIYVWVTTASIYHGVIYVASLVTGNPDKTIVAFLHPVVVLYMLNPLLVAIIHWRGGKL
jgi:hypothetical protein